MDFFTNSLIAMFFISILSAIIGTYISLNKLNYFAGGIAHASFGGIGLAYFLHINPFIGGLAVATISGTILGYLNSISKFKKDSAIGLLWSSGMALGIIFANITKGYKPNLLSFLFGDILTVPTNFLISLAIITIIILILSIIFFNRILLLSFDKEYSKINNLKTKRYNITIFILMAMATMFIMKSSGLILVISMMTIPVMISELFTSDIKKISLLTFLIALVSQYLGLFISFKINLSTAPIIIILLTFTYLILRIIKGKK